jgi:hypothetical protein
MNYTLQEGADISSQELAERLEILINNHSRLVRQYLLGKRKGQGKHKSMLDKLVDKDTLQEIEASANILESTLEKCNMASQLRFEMYRNQAVRELTTL